MKVTIYVLEPHGCWLKVLTGQPADNAAKFVNWLSHVEGAELAGVRYGVFGCGNRDWVQTYQRIPTLCDDLLAEHGGQRLIARGEGDASASNFFQAFDEFEVKLWETLSKVFESCLWRWWCLTYDALFRNSKLQRTILRVVDLKSRQLILELLGP